MAARQARTLVEALRLSSSSSYAQRVSRASQLNPSRGFAAEHHGSPKVDFWADPLSPSKWKEEHFVLLSLAGWGALIYGSYKFFTGGKKDKVTEKVQENVQEGSH